MTLEELAKVEGLINAQAAQISELQRELIAREHNVPIELVIGSTEEEMRASMKKRAEDRAKAEGEDFARRQNWVKAPTELTIAPASFARSGQEEVAWP